MLSLRRIKDLLARRPAPPLAPHCCETRHPILLVHGIAYRDDMLISSWGRIPDYLQQGGAQVFLGEAEAWADCEHNARRLKTRIADILVQTKAAKVNIIAHSKGGLDARYAIARLGMGDRVASLTTVCTPHRGTCIADIVCRLLPEEHDVAYQLMDLWARVMGDERPASHLAVKGLCREAMRQFNAEVLDVPGVFYQSYGARMRGGLDDPLYTISYRLLKKYEGDNDGMVAASSCQWGEFHGITQGVSHLQMTDSVTDRIRHPNIPMLYVAWVKELRARGF